MIDKNKLYWPDCYTPYERGEILKGISKSVDEVAFNALWRERMPEEMRKTYYHAVVLFVDHPDHEKHRLFGKGCIDIIRNHLSKETEGYWRIYAKIAKDWDMLSPEMARLCTLFVPRSAFSAKQLTFMERSLLFSFKEYGYVPTFVDKPLLLDPVLQ